ncbi:hypothetical protein NE237_015696 [Protea cynaroides]|uniref:Uncharacterized protein n=1 Tax=Protea cynaroides TaxID=273540 RepID=A0A9Q0QR68_9MAGN|nr:hypothetical protein NE237_015696 [Protea cynaroides]
MGSIVSKKERSPFEELGYKGVMEKIKLLQDEIHEIRHLREMERRIHNQQETTTAWKEAEWKSERKKLREEVRRLRMELAAKEEIIQGVEDGGIVAGKSEKEWQWQLLGSNLLVEHMMEEQARRDEAVEKWKRLYIAIKTELDTLIQRAHQGDRLYHVEEENTIEAFKRELKVKEETVQELKAKVTIMEKEEVKKDREIDILRQSLRIMSSKKKVILATKGLIRSFHI